MADVRAPGRSTQGAITPASLSRGTRLGRYELLAPIGVGGMAKVWAARQSGFSGFAKVVAVKTILPHLSRESEFERLFVDEARVASLIRHANVCEILELGEEGRVMFLVMEWVDGDSLVKLLKPGAEVLAIDPRVAARIAAETCAGLHAAHLQEDHDGRALNIVHRDVSPHNILLSADGVVKVTDFGVAKAAGQTHDKTVAGQLKGKLEYMSPEQIMGTRVDARTDVFGMGGVLFEATTGLQPFMGTGDLEVMTKIVEGRLAPPSTIVPGYPRELEAIVLRALATDPARRFASADEMRCALEDWLGRDRSAVTHADVAALLRERVGSKIDERLERIRAAMRTDARNPSHTPSAAGLSASGVIAMAQPLRVAPGPPPLPRPTIPDPHGTLPDIDGPELSPDSGFNMDTVADHPIPDFLNPGDVGLRPPAATPSPAPAYVPPPPADPGGTVRSATVRADDSREYVVAAVIGVVVALSIVGMAFLAWRLLSPASSPAPDRVQTALSAVPARAPPTRAAITFRVVPATATLVLDGRVLPPTQRTIPHFNPGATGILVVRAHGYQDETMTLDDSVGGVVDVVLSRRP